MRIVLTLLVAAAVSVALPAAADEAEPAPAGPGIGAALAPLNAKTLAQVHGGLTANSAVVAGHSRDIEMSATKSGPKVARPAPTPRVMRRMTPERVAASIDPALRACAAEGTAVTPIAFGLRVSVAPGGEVEGAELASATRVSPLVLACVVKAVSAARFGAPGATGASIVLPITVPGRVVAAAPADATTVTVTAPASAPVAAAAATEAKLEDAVASKP